MECWPETPLMARMRSWGPTQRFGFSSLLEMKRPPPGNDMIYISIEKYMYIYIYTSIINQMYIYKYVYIYIIFIYIHCQIFVGTLLTKLLTVCHRMSRTLFWRKDQQTTCRWHSHCSCIWTQLKGIWVWSLFSATSHNWSRTIAILDSQLANEG